LNYYGLEVIILNKMTSKTNKNLGFIHSFPALRGEQGGREFFAVMCPMSLIPKIFVFNEEEVPPELRAQRTLNNQRVPDVARYLVDNPDNYIVSALTASIDASINFEPLNENDSINSIGMLSIPMDAQLLINDGQHRRAAIELAIKQNPKLRSDNVLVLFFVDKGLKRSQQMFVDLNKNAVRPSDSLSTLYDHRDPCSEVARFVAMTVSCFKDLTEMEKSSISNRSTKLFTLSSIKYACRALLKKKKNDDVSKEEKLLAVEYWQQVEANIPDWGNAKNRKSSPSYLKQNYIHAHSIALVALGKVGSDLISRYPNSWKENLHGLQTLDWSRTNSELWEGRAMILGRISKSSNNVVLTTNLIKRHLNIELHEHENQMELEFNQF